VKGRAKLIIGVQNQPERFAVTAAETPGLSLLFDEAEIAFVRLCRKPSVPERASVSASIQGREFWDRQTTLATDIELTQLFPRQSRRVESREPVSLPGHFHEVESKRYRINGMYAATVR
jgi:hypothetical protein